MSIASGAIDFLVDTGAARAVIAYSTYLQHSLSFGSLKQCINPVRGPDGNLLEILGETSLIPFNIGKRVCSVQVLVMSSVKPGGLLGMDILIRLGVILNLQKLQYEVDQSPLSQSALLANKTTALELRGSSVDNRISFSNLNLSTPLNHPLPQRPPKQHSVPLSSPSLPPYKDTPDRYPEYDPWAPTAPAPSVETITLPSEPHDVVELSPATSPVEKLPTPPKPTTSK